MKLDREPRVTGGPTFMQSLLDFLRKVSQAVNGHDDEMAALKQRVADLEARVTALETP